MVRHREAEGRGDPKGLLRRTWLLAMTVRKDFHISSPEVPAQEDMSKGRTRRGSRLNLRPVSMLVVGGSFEGAHYCGFSRFSQDWPS